MMALLSPFFPVTTAHLAPLHHHCHTVATASLLSSSYCHHCISVVVVPSPLHHHPVAIASYCRFSPFLCHHCVSPLLSLSSFRCCRVVVVAVALMLLHCPVLLPSCRCFAAVVLVVASSLHHRRIAVVDKLSLFLSHRHCFHRVVASFAAAAVTVGSSLHRCFVVVASLFLSLLRRCFVIIASLFRRCRIVVFCHRPCCVIVSSFS